MKYAVLLGLGILLSGCERTSEAVQEASVYIRMGAPNKVCKDVMQPALCTVMVGCGDMLNMQVCEMKMRPLCIGPINIATSKQIFDCANALDKISCEDSLPKECRDLE